ncbi:carbohydrate sulfotransferase 5-like [Penaeus indicus]|uniref:carbohydrate sulfotransferase 5-like n=1 Tax=Penaeus indicus TaxID=29960 RepID=UPI00300C15C7
MPSTVHGFVREIDYDALCCVSVATARMGRRSVALTLLAVLLTSLLLQLFSQQEGSLASSSARQPVFADGAKQSRAHQQVLLWTQIRSGSSFTGRLLTLGTKTFYSEEPIRVYNHTLGRDTGAAVAFLKDILLCRFSRHLNYFKEYISWHYQDLKVKYLCQFESRLCSSPFTYEAFCRAAPVVVVRVVALALTAFIPLLEEGELEPRVVHLVRDPRATLTSRRSLPPGAHVYEEESNVTAVCERYREDLVAAATLRQRFPESFVQAGMSLCEVQSGRACPCARLRAGGHVPVRGSERAGMSLCEVEGGRACPSARYILVRYEDLALFPEREARRLYEFMGLPFTPLVSQFIFDHTSGLQEREKMDQPFTLFRNSAEVADRWRDTMSYEDALAIQEQCEDVLQSYGYEVFRSRREYSRRGGALGAPS